MLVFGRYFRVFQLFVAELIMFSVEQCVVGLPRVV